LIHQYHVLGRKGYPALYGEREEDKGVSAEENKALFRRTYEELLNRGDLSVADELVAPEFVNHEALPGRDRGPESMRGLATMLRTAFPDLRFEIEELIAEGDVVAGRLTMSGTHEGPLMGTPPTGRSVRQDHMHFVRFESGKAVEHWGIRDDLGMMKQLGLMPEPEQSEEARPT
jgi:predicted ester cyclase